MGISPINITTCVQGTNGASGAHLPKPPCNASVAHFSHALQNCNTGSSGSSGGSHAVGGNSHIGGNWGGYCCPGGGSVGGGGSSGGGGSVGGGGSSGGGGSVGGGGSSGGGGGSSGGGSGSVDCHPPKQGCFSHASSQPNPKPVNNGAWC